MIVRMRGKVSDGREGLIRSGRSVKLKGDIPLEECKWLLVSRGSREGRPNSQSHDWAVSEKLRRVSHRREISERRVFINWVSQ